MEFKHINIYSYLPIREARLTHLEQETADDQTLQKLKDVILSGWKREISLRSSVHIITWRMNYQCKMGYYSKVNVS